jgi:hypothetical protein
MNTAKRKSIAGAVAGALIGVVTVGFAYRYEVPLELGRLLVWMSVAALLGGAITMKAGGRSVSVFWPYLIVIFGALALIPCWYDSELGGHLPLATPYLNSPVGAFPDSVLLPHAFASIALAAIVTVVHKKCWSRLPGRPRKSGPPAPKPSAPRCGR